MTTEPGQAASDVLTTVDRLIADVVEPLEQANAATVGCHRDRYSATGAPSAALVELRRAVRTAAAAAGLYPLCVPAELGGRGAGPLLQFSVFEHLYASCGPDRPLPLELVATFTSGPGAALGAISERVRDEIWPSVLSGERLLCFALSEPVAAAGTGSVATRAVRRGTSWVLDGVKQWVSRGPYADYALVYAVAAGGPEAAGPRPMSAFLVPLDAPGVSVESIDALWGRAGGEEATIAFRGVRVPADHLVGGLAEGAALARSGAVPAAMFTAGRFIGLARWALAETLSRVRASEDLPQPLSGVVTVECLLADSATEIYAARQMALDTARRLEAGEPAAAETSMVRAYCPEMCARVHERCMQIWGGDGLTNSARLFDGLHQARIVRVAEGPGENLRRNVAMALLAGADAANGPGR
jgi:acyl-CoA dehydrogenase